MKLKSRIDNMLKESNALRVSDVNESIAIAYEALSMSEAIHDQHLVARCHNELGFYKMIAGKNDAGVKHTQKALNYFKKIDDKHQVAIALFTLASIHYKSAEYAVGLDYLLRCLELNRELEDLNSESRTLKSIGYIYEVFNDYDNAFDTYLRCKEISESVGDAAGQSNAAISLASLYVKRGEIENALSTINESIDIKNRIGDKRGLAFAYYHKAKIHWHQKDDKLAVQYFEDALAVHEHTGENLGKLMCNLELGALYLEKGNIMAALNASSCALSYAENLQNDEMTAKAYHLLYKIAKIEENFDKALQYHEKYHTLTTSVIRAESAGKIKNQEITLRARRLERETKIQKEKNQAIKRKNAELDSFVYRVSHDLKGPLSSMLGLITIINRDIDDDKALAYFNMYHSQAERLNEIVTGLIELTRIKEKELIKGEVDFEQIIKKCIHSFEHIPKLHNVQFEISIEPEIKFCSDHRVITSILQNLIENAIKYSKESEVNKVTIDISTTETRLRMKVSDNGIGIPDELMPQIFDMFFRANGAVPGSGLGLYILKNAVERLEGTVEVDSEENFGASFVVNLPF
ncbi:MAG: tetratricopeptide repeat-containing sensor histidine kinase, partial [Bacteroidota bacterium]